MAAGLASSDQIQVLLYLAQLLWTLFKSKANMFLIGNTKQQCSAATVQHKLYCFCPSEDNASLQKYIIAQLLNRFQIKIKSFAFLKVTTDW